MEGGRKSWPIENTTYAIIWKTGGNLRKGCVKTSCLRVDTWTANVLNVKQDCYMNHYTKKFGTETWIMIMTFI